MALERIPFARWPWRHDIGMPGKTKNRVAISAAGPEIGHAGKQHRFAAKTRSLKSSDQHILATGIIGRNGWTSHEFVKKFND